MKNWKAKLFLVLLNIGQGEGDMSISLIYGTASAPVSCNSCIVPRYLLTKQSMAIFGGVCEGYPYLQPMYICPRPSPHLYFQYWQWVQLWLVLNAIKSRPMPSADLKSRSHPLFPLSISWLKILNFPQQAFLILAWRFHLLASFFQQRWSALVATGGKERE